MDNESSSSGLLKEDKNTGSISEESKSVAESPSHTSPNSSDSSTSSAPLSHSSSSSTWASAAKSYLASAAAVPVSGKEKGKRKKVVLDTAPFIRGVRFESFGDEFYTVPEVLKEIRDSKARAFLDQIMVPIRTREPTPEAYNAVVEFSRKSGDYPSLSRTDLKVLALVYLLEKETCGTAHLRTEPKSVCFLSSHSHITLLTCF